jgi:hypothetical protein
VSTSFDYVITVYVLLTVLYAPHCSHAPYCTCALHCPYVLAQCECEHALNKVHFLVKLSVLGLDQDYSQVVLITLDTL